MTAGELVALDAEINRTLWRWRGHVDLDDMTQEARIKAWRAIEKSRAAGGALSVATAGQRAAKFAAVDHLRSPGALRRWNRWTKEEIVPFSLDAIRDAAEEEGECDLDKRSVLPAEADFSPELVERIGREALCAGLLARVSTHAARVLHRYYWDDWTMKAIGAELGVSEAAAHMLVHRALDACRVQLGLPLKYGKKPLASG